jgi:hypothetical protein
MSPSLKLVPSMPIQPSKCGVRHYRTHAERLAGEIYSERTSHKAAAAVCAHEIAAVHDLFAGWSHEACGDDLLVLLEPDQFAPEFDSMPGLREPLAHHLLCQELRNHQRDVIRLCRCRILTFGDILFDIGAVIAILTQ